MICWSSDFSLGAPPERQRAAGGPGVWLAQVPEDFMPFFAPYLEETFSQLYTSLCSKLPKMTEWQELVVESFQMAAVWTFIALFDCSSQGLPFSFQSCHWQCQVGNAALPLGWCSTG